MGNVMNNKYAEGYPGRRYYGGCEIVDQAEQLAIDRIKKAFQCEYANVQPHSGAQANASLMMAVLKPSDKILGLDLSMGGHLTHGSPVNFSGKLYQPFFYGVKKETGLVDYNQMEEIAVKVFQYLNTHFGKYPFDSYSIIQGGDGGMEYPMCTLILGEGSLQGLSGTMAHEVAHSWFQMILASNESLYAWMDEGSADFASSEAMASIGDNLNPHAGSYGNYFSLVASGLQEPASQHSDHFSTNRAYSTAAYSIGAIFLEQLKYLIGEDNFYKGMLRYYNTWKMRHPNPNDFIRVMEKPSGLQLGWYLRYWIGTTKRIDYGFGQLTEKDGASLIDIKRIGDFPMPIDLVVTYKDGSKENYYIPMNELMGRKPEDDTPRITAETWPWVYPTYTLKVNKKPSEIESIEIDPSQRMADIDRKNNKLILAERVPFKDPTK